VEARAGQVGREQEQEQEPELAPVAVAVLLQHRVKALQA